MKPPSVACKGLIHADSSGFENCEWTLRMSLQSARDSLKEASHLPQSRFATGGTVKFCIWFSCLVLLHMCLCAFCDIFLQVEVWIYWWEFRVLCYLCNCSFVKNITGCLLCQNLLAIPLSEQQIRILITIVRNSLLASFYNLFIL